MEGSLILWTQPALARQLCSALRLTKARSGPGMDADCKDFKYKELTEKIIEIFYRVYNKLGYGFLEKVYEEVKRKAFDNSRK